MTIAHPAIIDYGPDIEPVLARLTGLLLAHPDAHRLGSPRWLALKLLEDDRFVIDRIAGLSGGAALVAEAEAARAELGVDAEIRIAEERYAAINALVNNAVSHAPGFRLTLSDRIDSIATHPTWGMVIFVLMMWLVFQVVANVSAYYLDWVDGVFSGPFTRWVTALAGALGLGGTWVEGLLADGVLAGVGGVLVFVPVLAFMYAFTAILEDSGYMARAALMSDRFMSLIGLQGNSFIPMLLGFGCNVPAIYATRTLRNPRDRILTALLVPYMSCGARLPVYVLIGAAFFGRRAGLLVFSMYFAGVVVAILLGWLLRHTLLKQEETLPFLIELPPYRLPSLRNVGLQTWMNTKAFVEGAFRLVLIVTIIIWLLLAIPVRPGYAFNEVPTEDSALAAVGGAMAPVFAPAGFDTWQASSALVTGFVAKEVIVASLSTVYVGAEDEPVEVVPFGQDLLFIGTSFISATWDTIRATVSLIPGVDLFGPGEDDTIDAALVGALRESFTPLSAVAYCVFILLTVPCMVTVSAMKQEFGTRWMAISVGLSLTVSWLAAVLVYQVGGLFFA